MTPCRLIVDPPQEGTWNMGGDEWLLREAAGGGALSLRFYQWREPTLSLGYFQRHDERLAHAASRDAAAVRRISGGGALVHDRELTYSLCLPPQHNLARNGPDLYAKVHRTLIDALATWGVAAVMYGECPKGAACAAREEPFLCFSRRSPADVVVPSGAGGAPAAKVAGSAQRRRRGAVLQHGSVLLAASPQAPELPGIEELTGVAVPPAALADRWQSRLAEALELQVRLQTFDDAERDKVRQICVEKYAAASWTKRR